MINISIDYRENNVWTVYVHINKINGKTYVGITSMEPEKRWRADGYGYRTQPFFRAIQKYGWENFDHEIVASNLTREEANDMEQTLIEQLDSLIGHNGYNATEGGDSIRITNARPVLQYTKEGKFVKEYESVLSAGKELEIYYQGIIACCEGKLNHSGGYVWRYKESNENLDNYNKFLEENPLSEIKSRQTSLKVLQFDLKGNLIQEFKSATVAAATLGNDVKVKSIQDACRGTTTLGALKTYHGYIWKYAKDYNDEKIEYKPVEFPPPKLILQFEPNGLYVTTHKGAKAAIASIGKTKQSAITSIYEVCNGKQKTAYGYIWRYITDLTLYPEMIPLLDECPTYLKYFEPKIVG